MTCAEVMRMSVMSVTGDETIGDALNLLDKRRIKPLPVLDSGHRLIGVDLQPLHPRVRRFPGEVDRRRAQRERRQLPDPQCDVVRCGDG